MKPIYRIIVDGNDITNLINPQDRSLLQRLSVSDKIGNVSDTCDFTLVFDGSYRLPPTKGLVEISIGYDLVIPRNVKIEYGLWEVGKFVIESINFSSSRSNGRSLQVSATSMPQSPNTALNSLQNSHTRYWQSHEVKGTTFEDIVNEVCSAAGLEPEIHENLKNIKMPFTAQTSQTDAEFLTQISSIRDGQVKYSDKKVIITLKDKSLLPEITIDASVKEIVSYSWSTSSRNDIRRVDATYKDDNNKIITVSVGSGEPAYIIKDLQPDVDTARDVADSLLSHTQRNQTSVNISMATHPNLRAETPIKLTNFDEPEIDGTYIVEEVNHQLNKSSGLISTITAKLQASDRNRVLAQKSVFDQLTAETETLVSQ